MFYTDPKLNNKPVIVYIGICPSCKKEFASNKPTQVKCCNEVIDVKKAKDLNERKPDFSFGKRIGFFNLGQTAAFINNYGMSEEEALKRYSELK